MSKKRLYLYPGPKKELEALGERLKEARLRRRFPMSTVSVRAGITPPTLRRVEAGDPAVAIGIYMQVLRVLGLASDMSLVAKEDVLGRKLQDESLPRRKRAPRRKVPMDNDDG